MPVHTNVSAASLEMLRIHCAGHPDATLTYAESVVDLVPSQNRRPLRRLSGILEACPAIPPC